MTRAASLAQLASLSPVQSLALRLFPAFQVALALLIVAENSGYPIGF
ncbi:MAG TPA: hypothetical protein VJB60_00465 [Candidatus Peribacterales bacterium]|nr:hypothetical protein [Candidatus Peribacterales bacterium]